MSAEPSRAPHDVPSEYLFVPSMVEELASDRSRLRVCIAASIAFHVALFAVILPVTSTPAAAEPDPDQPIFVIRPFKPKPREPEVATAPPQPTEVTIPVPTLSEAPPDEIVPVEEPPVIEVPVVSLPPVQVAVPDPPPPPPPVEPIRFGADMTKPVKIYGPVPAYTEIARRAHGTGIVILEAVIDADGSVRDVKVLKPLPWGLTESAIDAVRDWRFEPARLDDRPVAVIYNLTVRFVLS